MYTILIYKQIDFSIYINSKYFNSFSCEWSIAGYLQFRL